MIGGGCTDKDKGLGKDMGRVCNGHGGIIGRESDGQRVRVRKAEELGSSRLYLLVRITLEIVSGE